MDYIDTQYEKYLQEELKINRNIPNYHDTRVHVCLYFLSPTGHSIKSLDLVTMKALDTKVVVVCFLSLVFVYQFVIVYFRLILSQS